jgi:hypothetical protein
MEMTTRQEIINNAETSEKLHTLKSAGDAQLGPLVRLEMGNIYILKENFSFLRMVKSIQTVQETGLPCPIWPYNSQDFTGGHVDLYILEGHHSCK